MHVRDAKDILLILVVRGCSLIPVFYSEGSSPSLQSSAGKQDSYMAVLLILNSDMGMPLIINTGTLQQERTCWITSATIREFTYENHLIKELPHVNDVDKSWSQLVNVSVC